MRVQINLKQIMITLFCLAIGVYSSFYYFNFGIPQIIILYTSLALLILSKPDLRIQSTNGQLLNVLLIVVSMVGLFIGSFNSNGTNYLITLVVLMIISGICRKNCAVIRNIYSTMYFFSVISVLSIYYEYLFPESFFSLAKNLLSVGSYNTLRHVYSTANAYGGLAGYTSLASFSCVIMCACTFSTIFGSNRKLTGKEKILNIVGFLMSIFAVVLTTKRSLFLAIIIAAILVFVFTKNLNRKAKYSMLFIAALGLFVLLFFVRDNENVLSFLQRFEYTKDKDFTSGRNAIITQTMNYLGSGWLIGNGTGSGSIYANNSLGVGGGLHNIYIQVLFENGVVGLVLWIAVFVNNLKDASKKRYDNSRPYVMASLFVQICFLIYGFFGNPLYDLCILCSYFLFSILPAYIEKHNK